MLGKWEDSSRDFVEEVAGLPVLQLMAVVLVPISKVATCSQ